MKSKYIPLLSALTVPLAGWAQSPKEHPAQSDTIADQTVQEVSVVASQGIRRMKGAGIGDLMGKGELFKAACCNLGESFVNNPSVDVNYSDATTGAKQIRLLGLAGTYVQMLTENLPAFRGAAAPYALDYVPGPWMKSIQVSKGSASVRNGHESLAGQINVQYLQPEDEEKTELNLYGNTMSKMEANLTANHHFNGKLSTGFYGHFQNSWDHHDGNSDGFLDEPNVRQYNFANRWVYLGSKYIFHGGLSLLDESRKGGQRTHDMEMSNPFKTDISTRRYEGYMKHAFILDPEHGTNIAWMTTATMHLQDAGFGLKTYDVNEKNLYSQLLFETNMAHDHNLAAGFSFNHDYFGQQYRMQHTADLQPTRDNEKENTVGAYAQYTYNLHERFIAMAGIRVDHSNLYGTFVTPRINLKWQVNDVLGFRASVGKGYRSVHALAENSYLMASGRSLRIDGNIGQEKAWTYGFSSSLYIPLFNRTLKVNAEYFYSDFSNQAVIDFDSNPHEIHIGNLDGKSYSHTFQVDASYEPLTGLSLTAAYRRHIVKTTYGGELLDKPLTNRYKALLAASYKTPLGLWQFDATLQLNGGGRMPKPYTLADGTASWDSSFGSYPQLSAQITRWFRHFSVYVGGENLTNFKQKHPIIGYDNPWGTNFEPNMIWGPVRGAMGYVGIRLNLGKI